MFEFLKYIHIALVVLFIISTLVKAILLFTNKEKFTNYREKTKMPEIMVSVLFLVSGLTLLIMKGGQVHDLFWVKVGMIVVAIPLTIVGFKKEKKIPAMLGAFLFIMTYGVAEMAAKRGKSISVAVDEDKVGSVEHGSDLYIVNCAVCHGPKGDKGMDGASNLQLTTLSKAEIETTIINGRGRMKSFEHFSSEELSALSSYVLSLKKNN